MPRLPAMLRYMLTVPLRPTNAFGLVAVAVVVLSGLYAEVQNRTVFEQNQRAQVASELSVIRARLEGAINANLQLVYGLVSVISTEPDMDQQRFSALARTLFEQSTELKSIAAAPDLVIRLIYPLAGNEKALGLDYRNSQRQRDGVLRAQQLGRLVVAGPIDLVQGGRGFIGRYPVYVPQPDGNRSFWGVVSVVVDEARLFADTGLSAPDLPIDIALVGRDALGDTGGQFYGPPRVLVDNPVTAEVALPNGAWRIAASPKGGWRADPPNQWLIRAGICLAGALVLMPLAMARRLVNERQRHIGELRSREEQLVVVSRRLQLALDASQVGVWEYVMHEDRLVWDDRMNELYGLPADGGPRSEMHWRSRLHPDDRVRAKAEFDEAMNVTGRYDSQYRLKLPDGTVRHIKAIGAVYRDAGHAKIIGVNWDVSADVARNADLERANALTEARNAELTAAKARIEHNALHDALTGLPNRRYLDQMLEQRACACRENGGGLALLHIDLDRFKQINDTLGHAAGDAMLVHAAEVLKANVRDTDFVARIGGDEFVVLSSQKGSKYLSRLADRIIQCMSQPIVIQGHESRCGVSVGIAFRRGKSANAERLLIDADIALYRAKNQGRNRSEFFTPALHAEIVNAKQMADEILAGIDNNEFVAHFQPQFDAGTLAISGVEALARWRHPTRGMVPPDVFLPIAEDLNVVATIDRMVLDQALSNYRYWQALGLDIPCVSVNVSGRRLRDAGLVESLRNLDIPPGAVSFELVESIYLDERDELVALNIERIKELGIGIEIDDFGTGYASIVSVLQLKPKRLKIDRHLVMPIVESPERRNLIRSIVEIGHSLDIDVVAEGVETHQHTRILTELGADALQGYAFAPPLSPDNFIDFVRRRSWRGLIQGPQEPISALSARHVGETSPSVALAS